MHTGQKVTKKKDKFDDEKFIKIKSKQIISEQKRYENEDNKQYFYGFVNENTHLNMKMDLYMSNIYSRISLQAMEFYSQICEQTRNIRQLTLTQVQKNRPLLGYILTGDRSIFVKQEGVNVMKMYKYLKKSTLYMYHKHENVMTKYKYCIRTEYNMYINLQEKHTYGQRKSHVHTATSAN